MKRPICLVSAAAIAVICGVHQAGAAGPERISNSVPYRVSKSPAATGRSGNATLTARALLRKNGETDVELTTGALDSTPHSAPGTFTRVQVSRVDAFGRPQAMLEYPNLETTTGDIAFVYSGLARGQMLRVTANVVGIDGARTDIVSATPTVKLRPDLVVDRIVVPERTLIGVPVAITGVISERNHDVGARATCTLSVDGTEVDRAEGIWVDAGHAVSCAFTHTFATAGAKSLAVRAVDVVPSEYDQGNNEAAATVMVREEEPFDFYSLRVLSEERASGWRYELASQRSDGGIIYGRDDQQETLTRDTRQIVSYDARVHAFVVTPLTNIVITESTDGTLLRSGSVDGIPDAGCVVRTLGTDYVSFLYLCANTGYGIYLTYQSAAAEITYYSRGFDTTWHQLPDGTTVIDCSCSWNYTYSYTYNPWNPWAPGNPVTTWGSTYSVDVSITSGETVFRGPLTIALQRETQSWGTPWSCNEYAGEFGWSRECREYTDTRLMISGYGGANR